MDSEYEWVKFLFAGDTLKPECIEAIDEVVDRYPDLGAVFWPYEFRTGDRVVISRHYPDSRYLPPHEINELNIAEGGRLGAIVSNAYGRRAIDGIRFNEVFVGKADFDYMVLQDHGAYHIGKVLSTFNLEHHRTYQYALRNYRVNLEASFNRCCALERSKAAFPTDTYERYRSLIILDTFEQNVRFIQSRCLRRIVGVLCADVMSRLWATRPIGVLRRVRPLTRRMAAILRRFLSV